MNDHASDVSFQRTETFVSVPRSTSIPALESGEPVTLLFRITVLSSTASSDVLSVVVVPLTVRSPETIRLFPMVVLPVAAPIATVVAAPPIFNVVAFELNIDAVSEDVVISPPFTAASPVNVRSAKDGDAVVATS